MIRKSVKKLKSQHESLICKVKWIIEAKKHSDQRAVSMGDKLKVLREANTRLKTQLQSLKEDVSQLTSAPAIMEQPRDDTDHRLSQAQNELELARAEVELMEFTSGRDKQRIIDLESMLCILQKELEQKRLELMYETTDSEEDLTYRDNTQHTGKNTISVGSFGGLMGKGGSIAPRRTRCSNCKRVSINSVFILCTLFKNHFMWFIHL
nr:uncharacterized protein LOC129282771 [Lytechinus pictus]